MLSGDLQIPSWMLAVLPASAAAPSVRDFLDRLSDVFDDVLDVAGFTLIDEPSPPSAVWQIELQPLAGEPQGAVRVWLEPAIGLESYHLGRSRLLDDDRRQVQAAEWTVGISLQYRRESPLADFHRQLQVLAAVAPEAVCLVDVAACLIHSGAWLRDAAKGKVPPSPTNLYCIHSVFDEEDPQGGVWLHTHGLVRCGLFELEIVNVPLESADTLCRLINTAAGMFLDGTVPGPEEEFSVGHGLVLLWFPWESGLETLKQGSALGGYADRDDDHSSPGALLVAPKKKVLGLFGSGTQSVACYAPTLDDDPLLYVSSLETERMRNLATERMSKFLGLLTRFGGEDGWGFLVKLGYPTDGAESDEDREHLWFDVHSAEGYTVDATLTNQPYAIASMQEGDRNRHSLEWTSNWLVLSQDHGRFDPDTIVHLERLLEATSP